MVRDSTQIKYTIKNDGFEYHMKKCALKAGSTVSKLTHPLWEVEEFKRYLQGKGLLEDAGEFFRMKKNIYVGPLMAYNLHIGRIMHELPETTITINGVANEDSDIKDYFYYNNLHSSQNEFFEGLNKNEVRLDILLKIEDYDLMFFEREKSKEFSPIETFVVNALSLSGALGEYRRGYDCEHECDIVIESERRQIEIVSCIDDRVPRKLKYGSIEERITSIITEYVQFNYNDIPNGVIRKFTTKQYTSEYRKELAILFIGDVSEIINKLNTISDEIKRSIIRTTPFSGIHVVILDPFIHNQVICHTNGKQSIIRYEDVDPKLITTKPAKIKTLDDDSLYFACLTNIFSGDKNLVCLKGIDMKKYISKLGWVISLHE